MQSDDHATAARRAALSGVRVAVTGGAGFIGSQVVTQLVRARADVKVIDDMSSGCLENLSGAYELGLARDRDVRIVDVRSAACVAAIAEWRPDVVVHLAAQVSMPAAVRSPLTDADINIRGTVNVLEASVRAGVGLIVYAATAAIYGTVPAESLPVTENTAIAPVSPYGMSKATALGYVQWFHQHRSLPYTALALGNVYGPGQCRLDRGVIASVANTLARGGVPCISGDGQQTRDFVHVTDVADAVTLACTRGGRGLVNIASGVETTVNDIYRSVAAHLGVRGEPRRGAAVADEARRMVMDISRARDALGWQPRVPLHDGIAQVITEARHQSLGVTA
ncbi:GDP-mannose 4,6-dehydratase [Nocardia wallacei]|uniref:GDP-mannose 4,6-dehydratase n=1 Tax=Nocardia wallacei TaxID=480035 RepID=UPI00245763D1|nr:GDP-mannose 4,6-dehydratase [Nocardia wallacei]